MSKTPELPSGGGSYVREKDGRLKKATESQPTTPPQKPAPAKTTPAPVKKEAK